MAAPVPIQEITMINRLRIRNILWTVLISFGAATTLASYGWAERPASDIEVSKASAETAKNTTSDSAWIRLGDALMQKARETADSGYYGRAEAAYLKALKLNSTSVEAMVGMAWVNGDRHNFEASILWAKKALALNPKSDAAFGLIGDAA